MEEVACIFCRTASRGVVISENGFTGVKCNNCNLIYISPRPSETEVTHLYTDEHAVLYADAQFQFDGFNRMEASRTLSKIRKYRTSGALLELGPGGGLFLSEARSLGYEPYGVELNPIEAGWIEKRLDVPCENVPLSERTFGGKCFDIVYHRDVISHLFDPIGAFKEMNRALQKQGLLAFETGNIADIHPRYIKYFAQFSYPDHLFFFGEKSLRMLLELTGFKCLRVYKEGILLQLLLQRALWRIKDVLKDKSVVEDLSSEDNSDDGSKSPSFKRRLRLLYRYTRHYLVRVNAVLPTEGRPLKLLVIAEKEHDVTVP